MKYLHNLDENYIMILLIVVFIIGYLIVQRRNSLKLTLQYHLGFYGIAIFLLSLSIPHVFTGYPYDVSDLENKKRLLYHLQRNNEAIVKTTEAIRRIVFITFIFLLSSINLIIKHFKIEKSVE